MILVKIFYKDGLIQGFQVKGHAPSEFGDKGDNLLCAGVSTLVQSVHSYMGWKESLKDEKKSEGFLEFLVKPDFLSEFQTLGQMTTFSLMSLSKQHPNAIQIIEERN
ncbi:MAG: ribosomal-processing cysteine protease Prp [Leptospira sp.]|nr:ribosomal-processing cysteine protease Prp [Leptospira sp.]